MIQPLYGYLTDPDNQPWLSESPTKAELRADPERRLFGFVIEK